MIDGVVVKKLKKHKDERGWLAEIWRSDDMRYQAAMSYVSETKPGTARGPHEHERQSDLFVFAGPGDFELFLWDRRESSPTRGESHRQVFGQNDPAAVIVPPGVVHGYKCVSDTPGWCINLPDRLYKGKNREEEIDEIRWEDDPDSPYKID